MAYTLNDIDLDAVYGFTPTKAEGSNLALIGAWNLPKRSGKTYHNWAEDEGMEPYLLETDMRFEGRDIVMGGVIKGTDEADTHEKVNSFISFLNSLTALVTLSTDWGDFDVLVKEKITVRYLYPNLAQLIITMREPVVPEPDAYVTAYDPTAHTPGSAENFRSIDGIDGESFSLLGLVVTEMKDYLSRSATKDAYFTAYQTEGFQVTKPGSKMVVLKGVLKAANYAAMATLISDLHAIFRAPGRRYLTAGNIPIAEGWVLDGFEVSRMMVTSDVTALIELPIYFDYYDVNIWTDENSEVIEDEDDEIMYVN